MPRKKKIETTTSKQRHEMEKEIMENTNTLIEENCTLELNYIAQKILNMDITASKNDTGIRVYLNSVDDDNINEIHDYISTCMKNIVTGKRLDLDADETKQEKVRNDILIQEQQKNVDILTTQAVKSQSSKKRFCIKMDSRYKPKIECIPIKTLTKK